MKKVLAFLLGLAMTLSLCACGDSASTGSASSDPAQGSTDSGKEVYQLGDVIETDLFRIVPSFTGYARELANWPDENYMTPDGTFSGSSPFSARDGHTAIYGEIQVEYIGNEKSDVTLDLTVSADYDDGYLFQDADVHIGYCVSLDGDWHEGGKTTFEPLSSSTARIMRYCIEVPDQVETNQDKSLLVTFTVNGTPYAYDFRSQEDVLGSDYDPRAEFYQPVEEETKQQIISKLKENGLEEWGWYDTTFGVYTFTFGDTDVAATLPINESKYYSFEGTYEVYSGTILLDWDYGEQMHLDYTFDGTTLTITSFDHDR